MKTLICEIRAAEISLPKNENFMKSVYQTRESAKRGFAKGRLFKIINEFQHLKSRTSAGANCPCANVAVLSSEQENRLSYNIGLFFVYILLACIEIQADRLA